MQEVAGDDERHLKVLAFVIGSDKNVSTCLPLDYSPSRINQGRSKFLRKRQESEGQSWSPKGFTFVVISPFGALGSWSILVRSMCSAGSTGPFTFAFLF